MRYCNRDNCKLSHGTYLYHKHQLLQNTHVKITGKTTHAIQILGNT